MQFVPGGGFYLKGPSLDPFCSRGGVAGPLLVLTVMVDQALLVGFLSRLGGAPS